MSNSVQLHRQQPTRLPSPRILKAQTLEWVAISFSNAWKWKVKVKLLSGVWLFATPWTAAYQAPPSMGFSRQEYWSGVPSPSPLKCAVSIKHTVGECPRSPMAKTLCFHCHDPGLNAWLGNWDSASCHMAWPKNKKVNNTKAKPISKTIHKSKFKVYYHSYQLYIEMIIF